MTRPPEAELPLLVDVRSASATDRGSRFRKRYLLVLLIPVFMFTGAVIGLYFQPPALQKFYAMTGLQPGGGSGTPIALPPDIELPQDMVETMLPTDVVGLARVMPRGDVALVAAPYGASDARVAEILVAVGDRGETDISLTTFGIDPFRADFLAPEIAADIDVLQVQGAAILDRRARGLTHEEAAAIRLQTPLSFETQGRTLTAYDTFAGGGGFGGDGYLLVSDQTFLALFPARSSAAPDHILLRLRSGTQPAAVAARLREMVADPTLRIRSYSDAMDEEVRFQQTRRPTGVIFGFGVLIGVLVGIVIVFQVLSADVADHLREYATFKAMGYGQGFFLGVVVEEAIILGVRGFIPGVIAGWGILTLMAKVTTLPLFISFGMAVTVFIGTVVFSALSGMLATRRLAAADPADLF